MKLLFQTLNRHEVDEARLLLESRGIPVFISNENSGTLMSAFYAAKPFGVWAVLEHQHEDAQQLLDNPDYEVREPVDIEAFHLDMQKQKPEILNKMLLWSIGLAGLLFALHYFFSVYVEGY